MAFDAGSVVGKILADLTEFKEGLNKAKGEMATFGQKMKDDFENASNASKTFAIGLAGIGVAAVAMGTLAFNAYKEAEVADKQLEHAVRQVTGATEEQLEATRALADELERKGVLDGDNIKVGLAQLSTFGLQNETVQALAGSVADLAVNQFGVNASGDQLAQTANMIQKALQGQFGVLEKSGIRFTDLQKSIIMTGTEMEKAAAINEGFAQNLKFTNEVAMQTSEGMQAHLMVQLGNIQEAFGQLVAVGVTPLISAFSEWLDSIGGAEGIMQRLNSAFQVLQPFLPIIAGVVLGALTPAFIAWGIAMWGVVTAAAAGVVALLPYMAIGAAIAGVAYLIYEAWTNNFGGIQDKVTAVIDFIQPYFENFVANVKLWMQQFVDAVVLLKMAWEENWYGIQDIATAVWSVLTTYFQAGWDIVRGIFKVMSGLLTGDWKLFWSGILTIAQGAFTIVSTAAGLLWDGIRAAFDVGTKYIGAAWASAMNGISSLATSVWDGVKSAFKSAINWIIQKLNSFLNGFNAVISKVPGGGKGLQIPTIPQLAEGGIVSARPGGILANIGEGRYDEAVVPLDGKHSIGGSPTFIFQGPVSSKEVAREMLDEAFNSYRPNLGL